MSRTALLVEDSPIIQPIHQRYLKQLGFQVDLADNAYRALELASKSEYDCLLLDIGLPDISGESVLAAIRYRERRTGRHLPIIVNSAEADDALLQSCRAQGTDGVLANRLP